MSVIMSGTDESQLQPNELKSTADVQDLHLRTEWAHSGWRRDTPEKHRSPQTVTPGRIGIGQKEESGA
jgi:hypothetical protein